MVLILSCSWYTTLGAITKGDRRAATGADLTQFNFDTQYGRQSLNTMYESIIKVGCVKFSAVLRFIAISSGITEKH